MNSTEYLTWILEQKEDDFQIQKENEDTVVVEDDFCEGAVTIYHLEMEIAELRLSRKSDGENIFFLHFELKDEVHAKGLFQEMITAMRDHRNRQTKEILLSCTSGFTTSFFAEKLNEAAGLLSADMHFQAVPFSRLYEEADDADVILLAPQIAYEAKKVTEILNDKLVLTIPAQIFASYDTGAMITLILQETEKEKQKEKSRKTAEAMRYVENNACIFVINMTNDFRRIRYVSRLYVKGKGIENEEFIKCSHTVQDIRDILDIRLCRLRKKYQIDAVAISVPGILSGSRGVYRVNYKELADKLAGEYDIPVFVQHNTSAVAFGYYIMQDKYDIVSYHSQPRGARIGGQGIVYQGTLLSGSHHMAGEVEVVYPRFFPGQPEETHSATAEETMQALVCFLLTNIAVVDPQVILVRSELTPDMDAVRAELGKYMDPDNIPDLIYVRDITEYACLGTMLYGIYKLQEAARKAQNENRSV